MMTSCSIAPVCRGEKKMAMGIDAKYVGFLGAQDSALNYGAT
jgi:hypothetical protein